MEKIIELSSDGTLAQQCYDQLLNDIVQGVLKPGEKLKVTYLKDRLLVGQSPVREALSRLVTSGLVQMKDNKGFYVAETSESDIRDIYQTFTQIENLALGLAMQKGDDEWQANIIGMLYKLSLVENQQSISSPDVWLERNYDFHLALISGCRSATLLDIRHNLYLKFNRYCKMSYQFHLDDLSVNHQDHQELVQEVLQGNVEKAQKLMNHHINGSLEDIIKNLKQYNLI